MTIGDRVVITENYPRLAGKRGVIVAHYPDATFPFTVRLHRSGQVCFMENELKVDA